MTLNPDKAYTGSDYQLIKTVATGNESPTIHYYATKDENKTPTKAEMTVTTYSAIKGNEVASYYIWYYAEATTNYKESEKINKKSVKKRKNIKKRIRKIKNKR